MQREPIKLKDILDPAPPARGEMVGSRPIPAPPCPAESDQTDNIAGLPPLRSWARHSPWAKIIVFAVMALALLADHFLK